MDLASYSLHVLAFVNLDWHLIANGIILLVLLTCSALISGAEVAFFSLSTSQFNNSSRKAKNKDIIIKLLERPKKLLGSILITNNFINILIVLLFTSLGKSLFSGLSDTMRFLVEVILITFFILLFGEVLPKVYANRKAVQFADFMAKPLRFLNRLLSPVSVLLTGLANRIENKLGNRHPNLSVERLSQALALTNTSAIVKDEQKILEGIVTFGNTETVQIMKPRMDIFALSDEESFQEVLKKISKNGYSRNPVYRENIDHIVGILYAKDLLAHLSKKQFKWQTLLRKPFFVPENKKLDDLLSAFQEKKNHLAIVVDEYGGTSGIVTLEDIIEEIVGEINDDSNEQDFFYSKLDENNYIFEGKTTVKDFCRILNLQYKEQFEQQKGESETLAGFLLEISGRFPRKGEKISFQNFTFTVVSLDNRRIKKIKVTDNA